MRRLLLAAVGVLLASALPASPPVQAQPEAAPDTLAWEQVGTLLDMDGLFFDADTLHVAGIGNPVQVLRPGDEDFSQAFPFNVFAKDIMVTAERTKCLLEQSASGVGCSVDEFRTWYGTQDKALTLPVATSEGALLLGTRGNSNGGRLAARSTDGGATWEEVGLGDGFAGLGTTTLVVIPPSAAQPAGRFVAAGYGGLAYSDDDGRSWHPTPLYGGLAYAAWSSVRIPAGPHAGRLLAVVERGAPGGEPTGLYQSADGAEWARLGPIPTGGTFSTRLTAAPDGAVYAYRRTSPGAPVWRSLDGGQTWENVGPVWTAWPAEAREIVAGPDGRLWAACGGGGFSGYDGGVFRTVERVVSAAGGPGGPGPRGVSLAVYPNPARGAGRAVLGLGAAAEARLAVYDVLGREVAVLAERAFAAGEHEVAFEAARLPAGLYLVQVSSEHGTFSERLTVVR